MAAEPNAFQKLIENPVFYAVGIVIGVVAWAFRYLEDGHLLLVLIAGTVGLVRYFRNRSAAGTGRGEGDV